MSFGQWKPTITLKYQPFPKQACIHKIINEAIDSNPQDDIYNLGEHPCQKASLCSFFKGSYTLEAAVIIPVAAVFFLTLLFFFRVLLRRYRGKCVIQFHLVPLVQVRR